MSLFLTIEKHSIQSEFGHSIAKEMLSLDIRNFGQNVKIEVEILAGDLNLYLFFVQASVISQGC